MWLLNGVETQLLPSSDLAISTSLPELSKPDECTQYSHTLTLQPALIFSSDPYLDLLNGLLLSNFQLLSSILLRSGMWHRDFGRSVSRFRRNVLGIRDLLFYSKHWVIWSRVLAALQHHLWTARYTTYSSGDINPYPANVDNMASLYQC